MAAIIKRRIPIFSAFIKTLMDDGDAATARATLGLDLVGMVVPTARTTAHTGWLFCYGQNVSRTTYSALFTAISTTYGAGDGSTTFTLPDIRGRVVAGKDDMGGSSANRLTSPINGDTLGAAGGSESHTLATSEIPAHSHTMTIPARANSTIGANSSLLRATTATGSTSNLAVAGDNTGGGGSHNNMQPTIILNYMIFAGV